MIPSGWMTTSDPSELNELLKGLARGQPQGFVKWEVRLPTTLQRMFNDSRNSGANLLAERCIIRIHVGSAGYHFLLPSFL